MPWQDSAGDLIAAIYDTVIDTSRWEEVVRRIVEATKSTAGAVITHEINAAHRTALFNIDPAYADGEVLQAAYRTNPLAATARAIGAGEVRTGTHVRRKASRPRHFTMNIFGHSDSPTSPGLVFTVSPMRPSY